MERQDLIHYDPVAIEMQARKLRAEATAAGARAFAGWLRRNLRRAATHLPHFGGHRHA